MTRNKTAHIFAAFVVYAVLIVYLSLTVLGVSDRQIIIDKTVNLPILNLNILLNGFFISVPLIAVFFLVWLQLFLYKMQIHFKYPESGLSGKLFRVVAAFFLWGSLPLFLTLVAFKYVKTHEPVLSYVIGASPILGTLVVLGFWKNFKSFAEDKSLRRTILRVIPVLSVIIAELFLLFFLIPWAREGQFPKLYAGRIGGFFRQISCVNLSHQRLVTEPEEGHKNLSQRNFERIRLEGAFLRSAKLKRANLKSASLKNSDMALAVLEEADLSSADLLQVNFWNANLRKANLCQSNLLGAFLRQADLQGANLKGSDLRYARLFLANFQDTDLSFVDAQSADLWTVNFQGANLSHANLQGISLNKSDFTNANLEEANLQIASLWKANLRGANFKGADLRGAKGLEVEQLAEVSTLYRAKLDQELLEKIKEKYPRLIEKPEKKE